jgi:PAS domain S-box-containing protein
MMNTIFSQLSSPFTRTRVLTLAVATVIALALNLGGMVNGVTALLSHVIYIPIVLAAYWFPRRGLAFSALIAGAYGALIVLTLPLDLLLIISTLFRMVFFILIGGVVSSLSAKLRASEQQLHEIIEFLPYPTFAVDREGTVIAWNQAVEELTGVQKTEILHKGDCAYSHAFYGEKRPALLDLILHPDPRTESYYPQVKKEGKKLVTEIFIPRFKGGKGVHLRIAATTLVDGRGNITGAIESIRDITEQVLTESALQNTSSRLNTIAGIVRHGISRKLAGLYGILSIGVMKFDDPDVLFFIEALKDSAQGIQRQIDISREFKDIGTSSPKWIHVQNAVQDAMGRLGCGGVSFRIWTERLEVFADPHLTAVFYHIFDSAIKETEGVTTIVVTYHPRENGCAIIAETDGAGFETSAKESLFTQREERYGHGLFLAHEICAISDMTIRETGTPKKGTRFEILIPPEGFRIEMREQDDIIGFRKNNGSVGQDPVRTNGIPAGTTTMVRELRPDEFSAADRCWVDYHDTTGDPATDRIFAVFVGDWIVSLARCRRHPDGMDVDGIFTPEGERRKGYSRLAVGALVDACHNDVLYMHAVRHLTGFYAKMGFVPIEEKELPATIRERYLWAGGNLEGAEVQPMYRKAGLFFS